MPKHSAESMPYRYDDRSSSGYGRLSNKFHSPRSSNSQFPYQDPDAYEDFDDLEPDQDSVDSINKKINQHRVNDHGAYKSTQPFYFVAGNTKLSDCFFRTEEVLLEMHAVANSMVPFPRLYKKRAPGLGSVDYNIVGAAGRTGNKAGYASAPEKITDDDEEPEIYSLEDLAAYLELSSRQT